LTKEIASNENTKLLQIKENYFQSHETLHKMGKILSSYSTNKGLTFTIYKELKKLYTKRTNNAMNKCATELNTQFSEEVQMANKYMKKVSKCITIQGRHINTTLRSISPQSP
jgi:hypothetical protein